MSLEYIRKEAKAGRMASRLLTVVAAGTRGRVYISPTLEIEETASVELPSDIPHAEIEHWPGCTNCVIYGLENFEDLFSSRQLVALTTFSNLLQDVRERIVQDLKEYDFPQGKPLADGGCGAVAYADAVATYLAIAVDRGADAWSSMCSWDKSRDNVRNTFGMQAIPMTWDYAESNPFSESTGNWNGIINWIYKVLINTPAEGIGDVQQRDVATNR